MSDIVREYLNDERSLEELFSEEDGVSLESGGEEAESFLDSPMNFIPSTADIQLLNKEGSNINGDVEGQVVLDGPSGVRTVSVAYYPEEDDREFSLRIFKGDGIKGNLDTRDILVDWSSFSSAGEAGQFVFSTLSGGGF